MSSNKNKLLLNFGLRLSRERKRLGYTQTALAGLMKKSTVTQVKYESGETRPDSDYFFALNELGADIHYIITGSELEAIKNDTERQLLGDFRVVQEREKYLVLNILDDMTNTTVANKKSEAAKNAGKNKSKS